jgi:hypothetical protein
MVCLWSCDIVVGFINISSEGEGLFENIREYAYPQT